jgi:peroxiredoxin
MKKGDRVPEVNFRVRSLGEWTDTNTNTYFKDKRVILFSLPGAFTPTCSTQQLPGYEKLYSVFKQHNIDDMYVSK